jgi:aminomethyltransferase
LSLQGPRSRETLAKLTDADLSTEALPYYRLTEATVAEVPTVISRTGYSGELGYELYYPRDYSEHMWDAVLAAGDEYGVIPAGLGALRTTRMEKKYPLFGLDLSEGNTPVEANLGWTVRPGKGDFIGRETLVRQKEEGTERLLVGLEFADLSFLPAPGDAVSSDGQDVGKVTSADRGWWLGKSLAMGYLGARAAKAGTQVVVTSATSGESYPATVHTRAFHDPEMARARG